jgi:hypothetical protein
MSRGPQQRPPDEAAVPLASYSRMVSATTSCPASTKRAAAVALSTPPDNATAILGLSIAAEDVLL